MANPCVAVLRALKVCVAQPPPPDDPQPPHSPPKRVRASSPTVPSAGTGAKCSHLERELRRERQSVRSAILGLSLCVLSMGTEPPLNVVLLAVATALFAATVARRLSAQSSAKRAWTKGSARFYGPPRSPRRVSIDLDTTQFPAALEAIETQGLANRGSSTRWSLASCGSSSPNKKKKLDSEVRR